jgi:hypothetical protein
MDKLKLNSQMLPAQVTGRDYIPVTYIVTAPAASVPLKIPNKEATRVSGSPSTMKDRQELDFDKFPKLEGFF